MIRQHRLRQNTFISVSSAAVIFIAALAAPRPGLAAIAQAPLILGQNVDPNIMFILDDSGSMQWEAMPAEVMVAPYYYLSGSPPPDVYGVQNYVNNWVPSYDNDNALNFILRSSAHNEIYYNPSVTYTPWVDSSATSLGDADPATAYYNPANTSVGFLNLLQEQIDVFEDVWVTASNLNGPYYCDPCGGTNSYWPITYFLYNGGGRDDRNNYDRIEITGPSTLMIDGVAASISDLNALTGNNRTLTEVIQNFANWFQYYRSRLLLSRAGAGKAFSSQGAGIRVGFSAINETGVIINDVAKFSGTNRTQFFDTLYNHGVGRSGTPLRNGLDTVGTYYSDNDLPWEDEQGDLLACRQNYAVLMTDGYWNGSNPNPGDQDGTAGPTITGPANQSFTYSPGPPFQDAYTDTLADVAMKYWKRDLRSSMDNIVATSGADPAFWQHMVTFTVGLGVFGQYTPDDLPGLINGDLTWPDPMDQEDSDRIDDLFHAALNGHGAFFSASNPDEFASALTATLQEIAARTGSAASAATNTGIALQGGTTIYQPLYNSGDWSGDILAFTFSNGTLSTTPSIRASDVLDAQDWNSERQIITHRVSLNSGSLVSDGSVPFRWNDISLRQQIFLANGDVNVTPLDINTGDGKGQDRLQYLRGNNALEGSTFRQRSTVLGDLVHSTPVYVAAPGASYFDLPDPEGSAYLTFRDANVSRQPMLYVGGNDGMLHVFNGATLEEELAFIPASVYENLSQLSDPDYGHQFYVDATPTAGDAYYGGAWHTVLVGTTGAGGKSVFALEITNPADFTETSAASRLLWEVSPDLNADYADLGFTFSRASIVRMESGDWAAVFGNGYESQNGNAVLYIANIETGDLLTAPIVLDNGPNNGLSTPAVVDTDGDLIADAIYAGDLQGNLWKVDVSSANPSQWDSAFGSGNSANPLFTAKAADGDQQSITIRPEVVTHPVSGQTILFGTGQFHAVGDSVVGTDPTVETFYGIWDAEIGANTPSGNDITRSDLVEQKIISVSASLRTVTNKPVNYELTIQGNKEIVADSSDLGWVIDLGSPTPAGERVVQDSTVRAGKLIFTTLIPSSLVCLGGGTGWLMEVDPVTGGRLAFTPFDLNNNQSFDPGDYVTITGPNGDPIQVPAAGIQTGGVPSRPAVVVDPETGTEYKFVTTSLGNTNVVLNNPGPEAFGRQSWRQHR